MLTNTASDQDSRAIQVRTLDTFCPFHPAALIAGVTGEGDARPMGHLKTAVEFIEGCAVTWDTSQFRDVVVVLTSSSAKGPRHVSDQPASLREPYTAISAAITATDRLIADGHAGGDATRHVSSGWGMGKTTLDALTAAPSTQRHSRAARLPPWRCVLGRIAREVGIRRQRGGDAALWGALHRRYREGMGGKCVVHAAIRDCSRDATSARENTQRPRFAWPMRIARMPPTWPCVRASRRTVDSSMPSTSASSLALYVLRSGLRVMPHSVQMVTRCCQMDTAPRYRAGPAVRMSAARRGRERHERRICIWSGVTGRCRAVWPAIAASAPVPAMSGKRNPSGRSTLYRNRLDTV